MVFKLHILFLLRPVLAPAIVASALFGQPVTVDLDPSKTQIDFTLGDVLHTVHGSFKLKSGHLEFDPQSKAISGQAVVDAASGDSGSNGRDSRMKKNILETDKYPEITFAPTGMQGDFSGGSANVTVAGWFTIHGQRHQVSIPMQVKMSGEEVVAHGKFVVPYVAWGMKNPSTFVLRVNQQVEVEVTAVGPLPRAN